MSALRRRLIVLTLVVLIPTACFITLVIGIMTLGYQHDSDPQGYEAWITKNLGVQDSSDFTTVGDEYAYEDDQGRKQTRESVVDPFTITYWDNKPTQFHIPPRIWESAVKAHQKLDWCDPRLMVALAHSESRSYTNFAKENSATAMGILQFIRTTWDNLWNHILTKMTHKWPGKVKPERTDEEASMFAACVYTRNDGIIAASKISEAAFVHEFAEDPPVWNQHPPQAHYVWRAYQELLKRIEVPDIYNPPPGTPTVITSADLPWYKRLLADILIFLDLLTPDVYAIADNAGDESGDENEPQPNGSCVPLLKKYRKGVRGYHTGCEGTAWSCGNIIGYDYLAPDGTHYYAPFDGKVISQFYDRITPPNSVQTVRFDNGYVLGIMHLHYVLRPGNKFKAGQIIGLVGNIGNSDTPHGHIWLQKNGVNTDDHSMLFCK